ncbi:DNA-binding IclR family transcriptional regulator [Pseudonocardia eucalypti]|uniref:IclR family transcriptional regulator domain-containing protein n=1 Tax=Pseudonocardia eucalypti TaxID=648755 RepID=UPI00160BEFCD|nr:DNA-binding IclR family transcriptional regulator [Pseudonocardia eucalypti]
MVQSVQRAARLLGHLAEGGPRLGLAELAERLGVAKPTVHALLRTLEGEGLVMKDRRTGRYALGPGVLTLGNAFLETHELRMRSLTWADLLAMRADEAVWVGVLTGSRVLVVHHAFRPAGAVQILDVGASLPWHTCALGKAMVAFAPAGLRMELLDGELPPLTGHSLVDRAAVSGQLAEVGNLGYAVENQECALGDAGIAAPVFDRAGLVGAIGVVGPVERVLDPERSPELAVKVREVARQLSRELGAGRAALV